MSIFESLENLNVSEECFNDILNIVEELLLERNKENREKKEQWENKLNRISDKEKIKKTAEIKAEANREKEARNKAYDYSDSAVNPKDPMDYEIGMAYSDSYHNDADDAQDRKNSLIQKFSKKFKNRRTNESFEQAISIFEEIINELKDSTITNAHVKRKGNYENALNNAIKNPQDKGNLLRYMKASDKLSRNSKLSHNAFKRSGNTASAQIVSPERHQKESAEAKSKYDFAKATEKDAVDKYNNQLHDDRKYASSLSRALDAKSNPVRAELRDKAELAQKNMKQARKNYHDTLDKTNTVPRDVNYLKQHLEYQKTHDSQGNKK